MFGSSLIRAAEARALAAEQQVRALEQRLAAQALEASTQLREAEKDRQRLLDRILELSGQPPLYEKPQIHLVAAPPEQKTDDLPEVQPTVRIDDVHKAARDAMRNGTFNLPKGRV